MFIDENVQYGKDTVSSYISYESHEISIKTQKHYFGGTWQNMKVKMWEKSQGHLEKHGHKGGLL